MASTIDMSISIGLFVVFTVFILISAINFFANYNTQSVTSEFRTIGYSTYNYLFSGNGLPSNWEDIGSVVVPGLLTDFYKTTFNVTNNGTSRTNVTTAVNITFDSACSNKAWSNTVILYDSTGKNVTFDIQNKNFCTSSFLKNATIVFNETFAANENKFYNLYYSSDKNTTATTSSLSSTYAAGMNATVYPESKMKSIAMAKLNAIKNISYDSVYQSVGRYNFYLTINGLADAFTYGQQATSTASRSSLDFTQIAQDKNGLVKTASINIIVYK